MHEERFDKWLQEALDTDVRPSDDFTARVMARVAVTPQEKNCTNNTDKRKLKRMMTALAACAAIIVFIPMGLLMMPKGASAPAADGAAQESLVMDDAAADMEYFVDESAAGSDSYNGAQAREEESIDSAAEPADGMADGGESEIQYTNTTDEKTMATVVHLFGDEATLARAALTELGIVPDAVQDIADVYELTAEEADALRELLGDVIEAEGALYLTLELTE